MLKLYNTLTRRKEVFRPIHNGKVGIYSCGPTVYWYQHIGNLKAYIFSDILKRYFKYLRYKVKHVINITDVGHLTSDADTGEDKIEKAAKKEGKKAQEIVEYYFKLFKEDFHKLNILEPDVWSKATEYIKEQIKLIKILEKKGYTYKTSDGIYFDTSKFKNYGKFARLNIKGLQAGKRIDIKEKRNKTDFALWKFSEKPGIRQQEWDSPWGVGFPGWHLECSAMAMKNLGKTIDIHTGGIDHIPVHHTNEIAQSEAANNQKFVNYWMHEEFLVNKEGKMSKSKGMIMTISELEKQGYSPLVYRYLILLTHYRKPVIFTTKHLDAAKNAYTRLKNIISKIKKVKQKTNKKNIEMAKKQFSEFMNNDLNTPRAISYLWEILRDNRLNDSEKYKLTIEFDKVFRLDLDKEEEIIIPKNIKEIIKKREKARKENDWKEADKLRKKINKLGYKIDDTKEGAVVKKI